MKFKLLLVLQNNLTIYCDALNWILDYGDKNHRFYFPTLDTLLDNLLETRLTRNVLSEDSVKDISSVIDLIEISRVQVREDIEAIKNLLIKADTAREKGDFNKDIH